MTTLNELWYNTTDLSSHFWGLNHCFLKKTPKPKKSQTKPTKCQTKQNPKQANKNPLTYKNPANPESCISCCYLTGQYLNFFYIYSTFSNSEHLVFTHFFHRVLLKTHSSKLTILNWQTGRLDQNTQSLHTISKDFFFVWWKQIIDYLLPSYCHYFIENIPLNYLTKNKSILIPISSTLVVHTPDQDPDSLPFLSTEKRRLGFEFDIKSQKWSPDNWYIPLITQACHLHLTPRGKTQANKT